MKISYELEQGYIDVWNEESEEWDRYIKVNKESVVEEKEIPEKSILDVDSDANGSYDTVIINGAEYQISRVERYILGKINEIIDYLKSKGDE